MASKVPVNRRVSAGLLRPFPRRARLAPQSGHQLSSQNRVQALDQVAAQKVKLLRPHGRAASDGDDATALESGLALSGDKLAGDAEPDPLDRADRSLRSEALRECIDGSRHLP